MKKIFITILFAGFCIAAGAQTMYDAINLGSNNYYGTARTMGMGNAVTAVGCDLGSITINPAGSAVAGYSQFTFSPGAVFSTTEASWAPSYNIVKESQKFSGSLAENRNRFIVPNIGFTLQMETGRDYGLKSWTVGFVSNMTSNYAEQIGAKGVNGSDGTLTSMGAAMAMAAMSANNKGSMMNPSILDTGSPYESDYYWNPLAAYGSGFINFNPDVVNADGSYGNYYAANEFKEIVDGQVYYFVPGTLYQSSSRVSLGSKNDVTTNIGFNINDNFFIGVNLSIPTINYTYREEFTEAAVDSREFPVTPEYMSGGNHVVGASTYFKSAKYGYEYNSSAAGINAALGFIWLPNDNLRLGASIKTPTAYTIDEKWGIRVDTYFEDSSQDGYSYSPTAENTYEYRSPYTVDAGIACTFGTFGLLSVDYELNDFSVMKYTEPSDKLFSSESFYFVNRLNKLFCGVSHSVRVGAEVNVTPYLALRAGYNFTTNPERTYTDTEGYFVDASYYGNNFDFYENGGAYLKKPVYLKAPIQSFSCGIGYYSAGSFFTDFALRRTIYPYQNFSPYDTYLDVGQDGQHEWVISPCVQSRRKLIDAVLTFGWRF